MKSIQLIIQEIDDEGRAKPLHYTLVVIHDEHRKNLQIRGLLLRAIERFQDPPRPRD